MNAEQRLLVKNAKRSVSEARRILTEKGAPLGSTAAGKLCAALDFLCQALVSREEQQAEDAFWAQCNAPEGRR